MRRSFSHILLITWFFLVLVYSTASFWVQSEGKNHLIVRKLDATWCATKLLLFK